MKRVYILLAVLSVALTANAQRNYVPGIIITHSRDSLRGQIDYRNWLRSPDMVRFRTEGQSTEQVFRPADMAGMTVSGEVYVSRKVTLDITYQDNLEKVMESDEREYQEDTVLLQQVVNGHYQLYKYVDRYNQYHFVYEGEQQPPIELKLVKKRYYDEQKGYLMNTLNFYQDQLRLLFQDNPALARRAERADYEEKELARLFARYNQVKDPAAPVEVKKRDKDIFQLSVIGGASFNSYGSSGGNATAIKGNSVSPLMGIGGDITFSRRMRKFSLVTELLFKEIKGENRDYKEYDGYRTTDVSLQFTYLQLNVLFRYTYPKGRIKPYVNAGIANAFMIKENKNERLVRYLDNDVRKEVGIDGPRKLEQSLVGGVGAQWQRWQLEGRFATSNGYSPYENMKTVVNSWQVLVRYKIL